MEVIVQSHVQGYVGSGDLGSADSSAKNPLLGDVLVVLAQLLAATQFIVEEKYLAKCVQPFAFAPLAPGKPGCESDASPMLAQCQASHGSKVPQLQHVLTAGCCAGTGCLPCWRWGWRGFGGW